MKHTTRKVCRKTDYVIAIPSYKRAETLRDKSLELLQRYRIQPKRIYIFVANKEEEAAYKAVLDPKTYHKLVVGVPKIGPQRNFISDYFPVGKPVVHMDDDISSFLAWSPTARRNEIELKNLESVIQRGFQECREAECSLWGIYPVANGYFMRKGSTTDLKFVIGTFNGCFNPGTKGPKGVKLALEMDKEDYERSIRFYRRDGAVVRLCDVAPKTAYYTEKGGNQEFRTMKTVMDGAKRLVAMFPEHCELNLTKKSGYPEIRLKLKGSAALAAKAAAAAEAKAATKTRKNRSTEHT
jgi:hypothetical protein